VAVSARPRVRGLKPERGAGSAASGGAQRSRLGVSRQLVELRGGGFGFAPPKSDAGKRVVVIRAAIMPVVREHVGRTGGVDDRQRIWLPALRAAELPLIHFHDLRHTGNMLAAGAGAGLRELMERMGHSTTRPR
jgi:integrase